MICKQDVSLILKTDCILPLGLKTLSMSNLFYDQKLNLLELEKISNPKIFEIFKDNEIKCPSCDSILKDKDLEEFCAQQYNDYSQRKGMRKTVNKLKSCTVHNTFVCEGCKSVCGCARRVVLCKICQKINTQRPCCKGKCFDDCHNYHSHNHSSHDYGSFCPHDKNVKSCFVLVCDKTIDYNCGLCNPYSESHEVLCEDCIDEEVSLSGDDEI